jgi:hypothetical protein
LVTPKVVLFRRDTDAALNWLGVARFKRCCADIAEFPEDGYRQGSSPFWIRDFQFREGHRIVTYRFWYVYSPMLDRISIMSVERVSKFSVSSLAEKILSLGADVIEWLGLFR